MFLVGQEFPRPRVADLEAEVRSQVTRSELVETISGAGPIAVAVGSRGITGIDQTVRSLIAALREAGTEPFIVPAMGSHGGATAAGQEQALAHLGITEHLVGAPVRSSMEVEEIGEIISPHGRSIPLYMDSIALREADSVVPVNRIKPHTGFRGPVESGLCKMLSIGLGKHVGAARLHGEGYGAFERLVLDAGTAVVETGHVAFGLAIVENAYEETAILEAIPASRLIEREQSLLEDARRLTPGIPLPRIDVLVVERFGKNISGVGMDPSVTGRSETGGPLRDYRGPEIGRIVVLDLTAETEGNAHGIGLADLVTDRLLEGIDRETTWTNTLTAGSLRCGRLPIGLPTDAAAIATAVESVPGVDPSDVHLVRIKDTLHLSELAVSEPLIESVSATEGCRVVGLWDGTWREVR
jgi:hypothetical protein